MDQIYGVLLLIVILALSITFHEFMHAYTSYRLGDETAKYSGRMSLNPLAHIDIFATVLLPIFLFLAGLPVFGAAKPVPFNPHRLRGGEKGAALVAAAGPLTNLLVAAFIGIWLRFIPEATLASQFLQLFVLVNIGFFVFNMIPFPPLDGSRILFAFAPASLKSLMRQVESFGLFGIMLFIFLLFPVIGPLVGRIILFFVSLLIPDFSLSNL